MITLACLTCHLALQISGEHDELDYLIGMRSDWYPDRYPCPSSGCKGNMVLTDTVDPKALEQLDVHYLNPQEAFQALHGMGLPEERQCNEAASLQALVGRTIKSAELRGVSGSNRTVIHSLTLDNDSRVYVGSSPFGALIYRIAAPPGTVQRVLTELEPPAENQGD